MINVSITIKSEKLKSFPKELDNAMTEGLKKGAFEVERKARMYAPYKTGLLGQTITTFPVIKESDGYSVIVAPTVKYGEYMERPGRVRLRGRRPYMKPSLFESIEQIKSHLLNEIRRIL